MGTITTYMGHRFDPVNPQMETLDIRDIAHALSLTCRGNGHVKQFYSVGQHCIMCAKEAAARGHSKRVILACLLHDASEAYLSDVTRPVKEELPQYKLIEEPLYTPKAPSGKINSLHKRTPFFLISLLYHYFDISCIKCIL